MPLTQRKATPSMSLTRPKYPIEFPLSCWELLEEVKTKGKVVREFPGWNQTQQFYWKMVKFKESLVAYDPHGDYREIVENLQIDQENGKVILWRKGE